MSGAYASSTESVKQHEPDRKRLVADNEDSRERAKRIRIFEPVGQQVEIPGVHPESPVPPHQALHAVQRSVAIRRALFPCPIEEKCISPVHPVRTEGRRMLGQQLLKGSQILALGAYSGRLGHAHDAQAEGRRHHAPVAVIVVAGLPRLPADHAPPLSTVCRRARSALSRNSLPGMLTVSCQLSW